MILKTPRPYPILCKPLFREKPWGGRNMEVLFHKDLPQGKKIGESWEAADLPQGSSGIANGPLSGKTLTEAARLWKRDLIGSSWKGQDHFPLLVKILDAREDLSVQVHPDEESCRKYFPGHSSKDESWIVLQSDPEGSLFRGFEKGVSLNDFIRALDAGEIEKILRRVPVEKGDSIRNAPGDVHALKKGVMVLEVQEPSDTTFRIYDYGRIVNGKPRPLHIEEAKKVMNFDWEENPLLPPRRINAPWGERELIVDCRAYRMERWELAKPVELRPLKETVRIFFFMEGKASFEWEEGGLALTAGMTMILPAVSGPVFIKSEGICRIAAMGAGGIDLWQSPRS